MLNCCICQDPSHRHSYCHDHGHDRRQSAITGRPKTMTKIAKQTT